MKQEEVLKQLTTPIGSPAYPCGPYRFTNRESLNILYRTDSDTRVGALEHVLAPLADFPVREIVSASHILTDLTLARAKCCHDHLDNTR